MAWNKNKLIKILETQNKMRSKFQKKLEKAGYTENTISIYSWHMKNFLTHYDGNADAPTIPQVDLYLKDMKRKGRTKSFNLQFFAVLEKMYPRNQKIKQALPTLREKYL